MFNRKIAEIIRGKFNKNKAILIVGPRQVGKTTLVKNIAVNSGTDFEYWNCDEPDIRLMLESPTSTGLRQLLGNKKLLIIDEAQRVANIGVTLKLIVDQIPEVQLIITGSSSLEIMSTLNEPLTGRKFEYNLYPLSFEELAGASSILEEKRSLEHRMIYGAYPDVVNNPGEEEELLTELASSYLFKDILALSGIRKPDVLDKLIKALAFQIGSQVSYNELADTVGIDKNTISKYIDLLEKSYVIFILGSYSRNLRTELKRSKKIYFWDTGIRNAVIKNFNPLNLRMDKGMLWENFIIAERLKYRSYSNKKANYYFWRTLQQNEIDFLEEYGGNLYAYEFKWNPKKKTKIPKAFTEAYPESKVEIIHPGNYIDFISG